MRMPARLDLRLQDTTKPDTLSGFLFGPSGSIMQQGGVGGDTIGEEDEDWQADALHTVAQLAARASGRTHRQSRSGHVAGLGPLQGSSGHLPGMLHASSSSSFLRKSSGGVSAGGARAGLHLAGIPYPGGNGASGMMLTLRGWERSSMPSFPISSAIPSSSMSTTGAFSAWAGAGVNTSSAAAADATNTPSSGQRITIKAALAAADAMHQCAAPGAGPSHPGTQHDALEAAPHASSRFCRSSLPLPTLPRFSACSLPMLHQMSTTLATASAARPGLSGVHNNVSMGAPALATPRKSRVHVSNSLQATEAVLGGSYRAMRMAMGVSASTGAGMGSSMVDAAPMSMYANSQYSDSILGMASFLGTSGGQNPCGPWRNSTSLVGMPASFSMPTQVGLTRACPSAAPCNSGEGRTNSGIITGQAHSLAKPEGMPAGACDSLAPQRVHSLSAVSAANRRATAYSADHSTGGTAAAASVGVSLGGASLVSAMSGTSAVTLGSASASHTMTPSYSTGGGACAPAAGSVAAMIAQTALPRWGGGPMRTSPMPVGPIAIPASSMVGSAAPQLPQVLPQALAGAATAAAAGVSRGTNSATGFVMTDMTGLQASVQGTHACSYPNASSIAGLYTPAVGHARQGPAHASASDVSTNTSTGVTAQASLMCTAGGGGCGDGCAYAWHEVEVAPVVDPVTGLCALMLVASDVSELVQAELDVRAVLDAEHKVSMEGVKAACAINELLCYDPMMCCVVVH